MNFLWGGDIQRYLVLQEADDDAEGALVYDEELIADLQEPASEPFWGRNGQVLKQSGPSSAFKGLCFNNCGFNLNQRGLLGQLRL